jgi:CHAT domain-containing protein/tetratricopeptide (TPR) repeat protein
MAMKRPLLILFGAVCIGGWLRSQTGAGPAGEATLLQTGKTIERQLAGGQSHEYRFVLEARQYAKLLLDQRSVNVAVACFGPDGKLRFEADSHLVGDTEIAELIADVTGTYRFRVTAPESTAPLGRYDITLREIASATEQHRSRIAAARAYAEGSKIAKTHSRAATIAAIPKFEEALGYWRAAHDTFEEARTLLVTGVFYSSFGDQSKALDYISRGLSVAQTSGDRRTEAWGFVDLATVSANVGDQRKAIEYADRGLALMRDVGDREGEGWALNNLGRAYTQAGDGRKGRGYLNAAMQIFQEIHDLYTIPHVASNLALNYSAEGEYQRALEANQLALGLYREVGDGWGEGLALHNVGFSYSGIGEFQKTLDFYMAALEINRKMDNRDLIAADLNNLAFVYANLGEQKRALKFYQEALELFRARGDERSASYALENMANSFADLGDHQRAIKFHLEALVSERATNIAAIEATTLSRLGVSYSKLGDRTKALDHFQRALAIHRNAGEQRQLVSTLRNLGTFYLEEKDYEQAQSYSDEALAISRAIHDRRGEAGTLADLARLERDRGRFEAAHHRAEEALVAFESLRLNVASPMLRASFFASAREAQEIDIGALMRLHAERPGEGFDARALLASERGRARSLLEMLGEAGAEIRRGVDAALVDRERELVRLISGKSERQTRLLAEQQGDNAMAAANELDVLATELDHVQTRIRVTSPQYAALTQPAPLDLNAIQTMVLDQDTMLLEYALGTVKSFLWAVTPSSVDVFELPPKAGIESAAKRVYDLLTARNQKPAKETPSARAARVRNADEAYFSAAAEVSSMLLGPAAARIANKRLLIVGEGVLQYLPFAALPEPLPTPTAGKAPPLIVKHEIVTAPSASVLAVLRREMAHRKPADKVLAILADPVFSADDGRIAQQKNAPATEPPKTGAVGEIQRSGSDVGVQEFARLRFSRTEAEQIARLGPPAGTFKALDFEASRDTALRPELGQYRILHFATHSLLNNQHPELSGVVLSLFDSAGSPQNGFLRLYDIYNLRLNADLVVLSACQTALGEDIKGEGLIGLTRGFWYAGAPRVVATLWEIDDRTTAEVMKRFYEGMLARGEKAATALRAAQVAMWRTKGWDTPYYWAAFTLQGEWR